MTRFTMQVGGRRWANRATTRGDDKGRPYSGKADGSDILSPLRHRAGRLTYAIRRLLYVGRHERSVAA